MIKGITIVSAVASAGAPGAEFDRLTSLFSALGFEQGKGWQDAQGRGAAFLAPLGNLEFVTGRPPAVPPLLVEVTQLDHIRALVEKWLLADYRTEEIPTLLSPAELTHWNSRMFTVQLTPELKLGFWQSENPLHNQPAAVEGDLGAANMRFAIVTTRWNTVITDRLLQGSLDALHRSGAAKQDIEIVRVPGAWEVPSAARTLAESKKFDAIITLGCLLRGETAHYEAIYNEVARGIGQSQQETGVPHAFGVLTCETLEQALDRAGLKAGNKGFEAATAAIEMVSLQRKLAAGTVDSPARLSGDSSAPLSVDPSARLSGLAGGFSPLNTASEKEGFSPGSSSFTPKSSGSSK
ncbi:MAG: 6,7-dimethyl-8-ribityllumazine synthase [Edaphobacter sp.]|nr:6,7-dimethyl-8-ribityllumazine synthase [Edaphobacter sp.]